MQHPPSALVVDDLADGRRALGARLSEAGFQVVYAEDGLEALVQFFRTHPDLVVTDAQMPRLDGIALVREIRAISDVPVVVMTSVGSIPDCEQALRLGADRYLQVGRDLDRIGEVARGLLGDDASRTRPSWRPGDREITATEARTLAREELRMALQQHLVDCRGNIAEIARRMGRDRSTIRYHLRRMGMLQSPNES